MRIAGRHWILAIVFALLVHGALGVVLLGMPTATPGGKNPGVLITISLGANDAGSVAPSPTFPTFSVSPEVVHSTEANIKLPDSKSPATASVSRSTELRRSTTANPASAKEVVSLEAAAIDPTLVRPAHEIRKAVTRRVIRKAVENADQRSTAMPPSPRRRPPEPRPVAGDYAVASKPENAPASKTPSTVRDKGKQLSVSASESSQAIAAADASGAARAAARVAKSAYISELQAWLLRYKRYPDRAIARRQQGTVTLYFVVNRLGQVRESRLEQSSGHRLLDREATAMVQRAVPMPHMPASMPGRELAVIVPIEFALR